MFFYLWGCGMIHSLGEEKKTHEKNNSTDLIRFDNIGFCHDSLFKQRREQLRIG
jgi:hypothetical protein